MKNIISLGLGVQSTALYYMSSMGELPICDEAIFVDLGREKKKTYDYLGFLLKWQNDNGGIPITVVRKKNLYKDLLNQENSTGHRFASIPAYTVGKDNKVGMLRRQCTSEYKIKQVDKEIRFNFYQSQARKRLPITNIWKGISRDEITRMSIPLEAWKVQVYPFCGWKTFKPGIARQLLPEEGLSKIMTRAQIIEWYIKNGLPIPPKSSCVFCPFQSEAAWYNMKVNEPEDFNAAVEVDIAIRNLSKKGINNPIYLHESLLPLEEVIFKEGDPDLWNGDCGSECHS